jgi:carbon-monoxide dehydrogenase large subunit
VKFGLGQPVRRREDVRLVRGEGRYLDDIKPGNEAHAVFVRSPHPHAVITSIDTEAARAARGVLGVLTHADFTAGVLPVRGSFKSRDGSELRQSPKALLPSDKVRFVGEAVVMVVAETPALAKDAAELVNVDYDALPAAVTVDDAPKTEAIWDHVPGNLAFDWADGDEAGCNAAFAKAAKTVAIEVVQNRVVPNPMEPRGAIGIYDEATDHYTLYTSTQGPSTIRDRIAVSLLKIPPQKLRVVSNDVGGGFGMKATAVAEQALVLIAAKTFGRPVKWVGERM